jgi:putative nucleotidyltransferase with HDIG domain
VCTWVATIGTISLREIKGTISLEKTLFNRAQLAVCAAAAGLVYVGGGGTPGVLNLPGSIPALAASAFTYMFLNVTLMVIVMALAQNLSPVGMWLVNFRWLVPNYLALAPIGVLLARVYLSIGEFGVLLFFLPLLLARHSFQRYIDMRDVYLSTVQALTAAIDAKDPYTRGHSDRVTKYAVATARHLKLPEDQVEILQYVALLHDMGKIGIKDSILNKPGKLRDDEYAEIKKHPVIGAEIAAEIKFLSKGAEIVRHHHEWYDGRGYPDGLHGEKIPLGARILAVADAYDAMTTDRPYRKALTTAAAIDELLAGRGTQFDPEIADALISVLQSNMLPQQE